MRAKVKQLSRGSGTNFTLNLDQRTYEALLEIGCIINQPQLAYTLSSLARRAIRAYLEALFIIQDDEDEQARLNEERIRVEQARRGV